MNESITCLNISSREGLHRNRLCEGGSEALGRYIGRSRYLTFIDLSFTSISNEGIPFIAEGVFANKNLLSLKIPGSELTFNSYEYIFRILANFKLKDLDISSNQLGNEVLINL